MITKVELQGDKLYVWEDGIKRAAGTIPAPKNIAFAGGGGIAKTVNTPTPLPGFLAASSDDITVGTTPAYLTGLELQGYGFELADESTGAVKNVTGGALPVSGAISFNPDRTAGGGVALVDVFSESSTDGGVTWTANSGSLRPVEVANNSEAFKTVVSFGFSVPADALIRFRAASTGNVAFTASSREYLGQTVTGYSVVWTLARAYG